MKLNHIAITTTDQQEVENFYHNILEMSEIRNFILNRGIKEGVDPSETLHEKANSIDRVWKR